MPNKTVSKLLVDYTTLVERFEKDSLSVLPKLMRKLYILQPSLFGTEVVTSSTCIAKR